jgi:SNF2 family DNA or RNA helicase
VLVITKAGGEGLDLVGVNSVVILDPTWNPAGIDQIVGRAIRYKSHAHLPISERKVDIYYVLLTIQKKHKD